MVKDYADPESASSQFRLAFNGPDGLTVSWNTPSKQDQPTVYYGQDPSNLDGQATGTSTTYESAVTYDNHVLISGLEPFTKYYYRVSSMSSDNSDPAAQGFYFTTARAAGDDTGFTMAWVGDLGLVVGDIFNKYITHTFESIEESRDSFEFLWHGGDFGYADDWLWEELEGAYDSDFHGEQFTYNNIMNTYYDTFVNVTKNVVYIAGPGNHDAGCLEPDFDDITDKLHIQQCPPGERNFTGYRNHFRMPTANQVEGYLRNMWYSFDYGMVHFVQLNTETDLVPGEIAPDEAHGSGWLDAGPFGKPNQQIEWLEADLASVERSKTPWIVVAGHRPYYSASTASLCQECQQAFESTLIKHNVDLVFTAHVHYYERLLPIANNVVDKNGLNNPSAPWYLINGAAGNFEGHSKLDPMPDYTVYYNNTDFGWSKLIFYNRTHLGHQFISSETGQVLDEETLYKEHSFAKLKEHDEL